MVLKAGGDVPGQTSCPQELRFIIGEKMDLNSAGVEALAEIPGIGERTAALIVKKRRQTGGFSSVEQAAQMAGLGRPARQGLEKWTMVE